jgi:hypothetical protein
VKKRPLDQVGGLGRQGAVRKRRGDVFEMNGHKFVQRQFYQPILCALCQEFLLTGEGYQCEDCRYACHKKCYPKVVTKCISKSNADVVSLPLLPLVRLATDRDTQLRKTTPYSKQTRRRLTIGFRIGSRQSRMSVRTGVATVVICSLLGGRMRRSARVGPGPAVDSRVFVSS